MLEQDDSAAFALDAAALPEVRDNGREVRWPSRAGSRELHVLEAGHERSLGEIDVVFPILHGPGGEDGTIQGMLELLGFPFVGSGVLASALGMHKHFTKLTLQSAGIEVAPWHTVTAAQWQSDPAAARAAAAEMGFPVFVKPSRAGSSVGVSKVHDASELDAAIALALAEDDFVLIEAAVSGREIEIAILGSARGARPRASVAGEIIVSGREFYDFAAKYLDVDGVDLDCPAELAPAELARVQAVAIAAFEAIGAEHLARVDFFVGEQIVVNEINTMPGFTPISMFPRCWIATGIEYPELISTLIDLARERGARLG